MPLSLEITHGFVFGYISAKYYIKIIMALFAIWSLSMEKHKLKHPTCTEAFQELPKYI